MIIILFEVTDEKNEANETLWDKYHAKEKRPSSGKGDSLPSVPLSLSDNYKYSINFLIGRDDKWGNASFSDSDVLSDLIWGLTDDSKKDPEFNKLINLSCCADWGRAEPKTATRNGSAALNQVIS